MTLADCMALCDDRADCVALLRPVAAFDRALDHEA